MPRRVQLMKQSPLHPLLLSAVADSLRRPFPEIRLLPDGAFAARDGRPGTLTGGNLNAWNLSGPGAEHVLDQWRRRETPLAVDYEHQSLNARHNGQPAPAAGWIESLRYEPGQGLFSGRKAPRLSSNRTNTVSFPRCSPSTPKTATYWN